MSVRAVPELIVGEEEEATVEFFGEASSPFYIPVSRQC